MIIVDHDPPLCERCGVMLSHLEVWARHCIVHMTPEQADALALKPTLTTAPEAR